VAESSSLRRGTLGMLDLEGSEKIGGKVEDSGRCPE